MVNLIEQGSQRLAEREEIRESLREIFTTGINLLETNGQLEKGFPFPFLKHQSFRHIMGPSDSKVHIRIVIPGKDLRKAKEVFVFIDGVSHSWLGVKKTGVKGQEEFEDKGDRIGSSALEPKLDGSRDNHIAFVDEYLRYIRLVSSEIIPQPH